MSLVIPLQYIQAVEKADENAVYKRLLITTVDSTFVFAQIPDRDFLLIKITELLSKWKNKDEEVKTNLIEALKISDEVEGIFFFFKLLLF